MKRVLKAVSQSLISTGVLLAAMEALFFLAGMPLGASKFVEKIVVQENLSPRKTLGEYRIFTYGESTIQGSQYAPVSSPPRWLQVYLKDFLPGRRVRVVNFARIGAGAAFIRDTFRQTIPYHPDLAIFYAGHNAYLHQNRKDHVQAEERTISYLLRRFILRSRFLSAVHRWGIGARMKYKIQTPEDRIEYDIIETAPAGLGMENATPRNEPFYWENLEYSQQMVLNILELASKKRITTLFLKPVSNLKDFSPNLSIHMKKLTPGEEFQWEELYELGKIRQKQSNYTEALKDYLEARGIDPTFADLSFRIGQIFFRMGELDKAREFFEEARDLDAIIVRATKDKLRFFEELQEEKKIELVDTEKILISEAPGGILGEPIIEDNVHFSVKGHSLVARALAQEIARRNWIAPFNEWRFDKERSYEEIADELGINPQLLISAYLRQVVYFGSRFDNRIRLANKALELDPGNTSSLRHLAWTYWLMGEKEKALEVYRRLGQIEPDALQEVFRNQPAIEEAFQAMSRQGRPAMRAA